MACARWTIGENSPSVLKATCKKWREAAQRPCIQHKKGIAEERRIFMWCRQAGYMWRVHAFRFFPSRRVMNVQNLRNRSADRPEFLFSLSRHDLFSFGALSSICIVYCLRQVNSLIGAAHKVKSRRCRAFSMKQTSHKWPAIIFCHCWRCDGPAGRCAIKIRNHSSL